MLIWRLKMPYHHLPLGKLGSRENLYAERDTEVEDSRGDRRRKIIKCQDHYNHLAIMKMIQPNDKIKNKEQNLATEMTN